MKKSTTTTAIAIANVVAEAVVQAQLFYLEVAGVLYSIKPKDYAVLQAAPTADTLTKYFSGNVLKHNPTCVFNSATGRKSFDAARPMVYLEGGKLIQQIIAAEPAKIDKQTSGGKTIKVAQTGPNTIYVRTSNTDKRPYSLKPEQLEAVKQDANALKYMGLLKHLPTCVEISLTHGLISTDSNRPMFELQGKQLVQIFAPGMEPKVEVVAEAAAKPKAAKKAKATAVVEAATELVELLAE